MISVSEAIKQMVEAEERKAGASARQRKLALFALEFVFVLVLSGLWFLGGGEARFYSATALELALMALGTMRLAHAVSYNAIGEPLRAPFTKVTQDSSGAGDNVEPNGEGWRAAVGELFACPICSGQWAALGLLAAWTLLPDGFGVLVLWVFGAAGAAELLHYAKESMEWNGRNSRELSGALNRASKNDQNFEKVLKWVR